MKRKFLDCVTAGCAIKQLVSNVEGKEYEFTHVPVDIKTSNKLEKYDVFLIYQKDKYDEMVQEVEDKFREQDVLGFLSPSENYVQLAFFPEENMQFYNHSITFSKEGDPVEKGQMISCIVDSDYEYINDVMNRWFKFDESLEVHKRDDIYQYIDCISKKRVKKESFVKKLFKNKND